MYNWGKKLLDTESPDKIYHVEVVCVLSVCVCVCVCVRVCEREGGERGGCRK